MTTINNKWSKNEYESSDGNLLASLFESKCSCNSRMDKSIDYKNAWDILTSAKTTLENILKGNSAKYNTQEFLYGLKQLNQHYEIEINNDPYAYNSKVISHVRRINLLLQESASIFKQTLTPQLQLRILQIQSTLFEVILNALEIFEKLQDLFIE